MNEQKQIVKMEYFELVIKINQANRMRNEKTKLEFVISKDGKSFFAQLSEDRKILLCIYDNRRWRESRSSKFSNLETFVSRILNSPQWKERELTESIKSAIFKSAD